MKVGDLVAISPWRKGHSIGIVLKQGRPVGWHKGEVFVHWVKPNGLGVAALTVWEDCDKLEVINENR